MPAPWLPAWALPCEGEFGLARGVGAEDGEGLADGGGAAVAGDDGWGGGDGEGGEGVADGAHVFGDGFRRVLPLVVVVWGGEGGWEVGGTAGLGPCEEVGVAGLKAVAWEEIPEGGEGGDEGEGEEDSGAEGEGWHWGEVLRDSGGGVVRFLLQREEEKRLRWRNDGLKMRDLGPEGF